MTTFGSEELVLKDGRKVILRQASIGDAAYFSDFQKQIAKESQFTMQTLENTPSTEATEASWTLSLKDPHALRVGAFVGQQIVAMLSVRSHTPPHSWTSHIAQFGMMVLKAYWGQGIGRRMIELMDAHALLHGFSRMEAMVRVKNEGGVQLYQKDDYSIEGTRKAAALIDGEFWHEYYIAKLYGEPPNVGPFLKTKRLNLRLASTHDIPKLMDYFKENEAHFAPTDSARPEGFFSEGYWITQIKKAYDEFNQDQAIRFIFLSQADNPEIVGTANFTQIFRGPFQACYLGYAIGKRFEGQGLMTEALGAAIQYVFKERNIHRIMANHLPHNEKSARVLSKLGFVVEGTAKNYLHINGTWEDHILTSLSNPDWKLP
jgi:ribosomal-protein-alanine N-acetyltransferase